MSLTIERATPADAPALVQAQIAAFHHDSVLYPEVPLGGPDGYDSIAETLGKIRDDETYKIVLDGQIIGGIVVFDQGGGHYHLDVINLLPEYHNRGIGTQAMQFLERAYPGATKWTLHTPDYARRNQHFYEKCGYQKVGEEWIGEFYLFAYEKRFGKSISR